MNIRIMEDVCSLQLQTSDDKVFWLVGFTDHVETYYEWVEEPDGEAFKKFEVALLPMNFGTPYAKNPGQFNRQDGVAITKEDDCNVFLYEGDFDRSYTNGKRVN